MNYPEVQVQESATQSMHIVRESYLVDYIISKVNMTSFKDM